MRWKSILVAMASYQLSRRRPGVLRDLIRKATLAQLPEHVDVDTHFKPTYNPWDQRLCFVPDGDLFQVAARRHVLDRHRHRSRPSPRPACG